MSLSIGIDLGTINTVMAIDFGDQRGVQVIPNSQNENLTKSVVGLYKGQKIVGSHAMDKLIHDPKNLIHSVKRLIGKGFLDWYMQEQAIQGLLYEIKAPSGGSNDDIRVVLGGKEYSPIELSAMILKKIKEDAEERLNDTVEYATITVPAYFTEKQREATRLAGLMAGFKVQLLLDEPTAAAIAFGVDQVNEDEMRNIVIYDLGGGTCDVSVLTIAKDIILKLNTEGDMWLGRDIEVELARDQFEEMIKPQVDKSIQIVEKAILGGGLTDNEIDNILLVGEWATIPFVQRTLKARFGEHKILNHIDPRLCIAYGAAIVANRILYDELDTQYQEVIEPNESNKPEDAERKAKEVEEKIKNNLIDSNPEWVTKAENLIWWSDLALQKFGGDMDSDLTYSIKRSIENIKKAIEKNEEEEANVYYADLDKVTDEIPPFVRFMMKLTMNSFITRNIGENDLSDKILVLISDIDNAYKSGNINLLEEKIRQAEQIIDTVEYIFKKGDFEFVD